VALDTAGGFRDSGERLGGVEPVVGTAVHIDDAFTEHCDGDLSVVGSHGGPRLGDVLLMIGGAGDFGGPVDGVGGSGPVGRIEGCESVVCHCLLERGAAFTRSELVESGGGGLAVSAGNGAEGSGGLTALACLRRGVSGNPTQCLDGRRTVSALDVGEVPVSECPVEQRRIRIRRKLVHDVYTGCSARATKSDQELSGLTPLGTCRARIASHLVHGLADVGDGSGAERGQHLGGVEALVRREFQRVGDFQQDVDRQVALACVGLGEGDGGFGALPRVG
jgi:hypothetical protein